jgi:prepilin-type N-terminal cleavage/methylation domain-containing protein
MANNFSRAFTFIELLVVMIVIGILASIAYPVYTGTLERAKITKDMNNLRQVGLATQTYMNDNDGVLFSPTSPWMTQLHPKYTAAWAIFHSAFDPRPLSEVGDATTPISYGLNGTTATGGSSIAGFSIDKVYKVSALIIFSPAQDIGTSVSFNAGANATTGASGVTEYAGTSNPGGAATGGTHGTRQRIDAIFADWHVENMAWSQFINSSPSDPNDPDARYRWDPTATPP